MISLSAVHVAALRVRVRVRVRVDVRVGDAGRDAVTDGEEPRECVALAVGVRAAVRVRECV